MERAPQAEEDDLENDPPMIELPAEADVISESPPPCRHHGSVVASKRHNIRI